MRRASFSRFGRPACGARSDQHIGERAGFEVLAHQAGGEHPASRLDALGELDLGRAKLDGKK